MIFLRLLLTLLFVIPTVSYACTIYDDPQIREKLANEIKLILEEPRYSVLVTKNPQLWSENDNYLFTEVLARATQLSKSSALSPMEKLALEFGNALTDISNAAMSSSEPVSGSVRQYDFGYTPQNDLRARFAAYNHEGYFIGHVVRKLVNFRYEFGFQPVVAGSKTLSVNSTQREVPLSQLQSEGKIDGLELNPATGAVEFNWVPYPELPLRVKVKVPTAESQLAPVEMNGEPNPYHDKLTWDEKSVTENYVFSVATPISNSLSVQNYQVIGGRFYNQNSSHVCKIRRIHLAGNKIKYEINVEGQEGQFKDPLAKGVLGPTDQWTLNEDGSVTLSLHLESDPARVETAPIIVSIKIPASALDAEEVAKIIASGKPANVNVESVDNIRFKYQRLLMRYRTTAEINAHESSYQLIGAGINDGVFQKIILLIELSKPGNAPAQLRNLAITRLAQTAMLEVQWNERTDWALTRYQNSTSRGESYLKFTVEQYETLFSLSQSHPDPTVRDLLLKTLANSKPNSAETVKWFVQKVLATQGQSHADLLAALNQDDLIRDYPSVVDLFLSEANHATKSSLGIDSIRSALGRYSLVLTRQSHDDRQVVLKLIQLYSVAERVESDYAINQIKYALERSSVPEAIEFVSKLGNQ